jgi:hypothetical protein
MASLIYPDHWPQYTFATILIEITFRPGVHTQETTSYPCSLMYLCVCAHTHTHTHTYGRTYTWAALQTLDLSIKYFIDS